MTAVAGERLREARESKGLTVEDVAARLRIPARYVRALEQGDLAALPEPTFVRGYLKAYARELALDGDALVAELVPTVEVKAPRPLLAVDGGVSTRKAAAARAPNFRSSGAAGRRRFGWLLMAVLVVTVLAVIVLAISSGPDSKPATTFAPLPLSSSAATTSASSTSAAPPSAADAVTTSGGAPVVTVIRLPLPAAGAEPSPSAASATPAGAGATAAKLPATPVPVAPSSAATSSAAAQPPAASVPAVPRRGLYIHFQGDSWVEVRDADNVVLHTSTQSAGKVLALDGKAPLTVTLGDSAMAELWYNGVRQPNRGGNARVSRIIVGQSAR